MTSYREKLFAYVKKKYRTLPEYPWRRYLNYAVFRHEDNQKWYALIMDIPRYKLDESSLTDQLDEIVDIVNVKLADPFLVDMLVRQKGFFRGYHIARGNWVSILLDGTVEISEICKWLDESYMVTASREMRQKMRPPKEWVIPSNPKYYDIVGAFNASKEIDWKQGRGIKTGDIVFMYVGAPFSAILYKCRVTKTDIPYHFDNGSVQIKSLMRIKLLKRYKKDRFTLQVLARDYGITTVRGPRGIPDSLSEALKL